MSSSSRQAMPPPSNPASQGEVHYDDDSLTQILKKIQDFDLSEPKSKLEVDKGFTYNIDSFLFNQHKKDMYYSYNLGGSHGLAEYLYKYAAYQNSRKESKSWAHFAEDRIKTERILPFLITTMHPEIVKSLICGDLSYRYATSQTFQDIVNSSTRETTTPGIYFNQLYDRGTDIEAETQGSSPVKSAKENNKGKGFSYDDWVIIRGNVRQYRDKGPLSTDLARAVDYAYRPLTADQTIDHTKDPDGRRYLRSQARYTVLEVFLQTLDEFVISKGSGLDASIKAEQAHWSIFEIGYGADTLDRMKGHIGNASTNWLWGLLNAIVLTTFPNRFDVRQGQLLYLCDPTHRNLGEIMCSLLASSYPNILGCSPELAGGIGDNPNAKAGSPEQYYRNIQTLFWDKEPGGNRSYQRGLENLQSAAQRIDEIEQKKNQDPLAERIDKAKEAKEKFMEEANRVKKHHELVSFLKTEDTLLKEFKKYQENAARKLAGDKSLSK